MTTIDSPFPGFVAAKLKMIKMIFLSERASRPFGRGGTTGPNKRFFR
jgi:hypothetical protein